MPVISQLEASRSQLIAWLRLLFIFATIIAAGTFLFNHRSEILQAASRTDQTLLIVAVALIGGNTVFSFASWYALMSQYRARLDLRSGARIFFTSQLGKYLPGGIWPFLAAAEMGRTAGFPRQTMIGSFTLSLLISLGAGFFIAAATLPGTVGDFELGVVWILPPALAFLGFLLPKMRTIIARVAQLEQAPRANDLFASVFLALIAWGFAGAHVLMLSSAFGLHIETAMIVDFTGLFTASWIVGFLFMIAPAGFGPREATMIALLVGYMPVADATLVALLSRISMTFADFLAAGLVAALYRPRTADSPG